MNTTGAFNKFFTAIIILIPFFVLSQKEYFPTNSGVKVVNEPYKAFVNATIVVNSEKTIKNGTLISVSYTHLTLPTSYAV